MKTVLALVFLFTRPSPSGDLRTASRSGHFIQTDEPELVVQAVRDVIKAGTARP